MLKFLWKILLLISIFFTVNNLFAEDELLMSDVDIDDVLDVINKETNKYNYKELDPYKSWNENVFSVNLFLFRNTMLPFIFLVDAWVPKFVSKGYSNFVKNILEPRNYIVYKIKGDKKMSQVVARRFFINTIFGMLGMVDVFGKKYGIPQKTLSFDCAFIKNKPGKYIILPITNQYYQREFTSQTFDWLTNPIFYLNFPFNYLMYILDVSINLIPNKNLLYTNRMYSEINYKNLRDLETESVFNGVNCK
jgi:ABC-type transporter lipoprotein component MlaA